MRIEFFKHSVGQRDIDNVVRVLNSTFLTTGAEVAAFEERFAKYLECGHVVAVTSCTAALHLSLLAYGVGPRDEVITTPMTFIATANAIAHAGATPVFVDVEADSGLMDLSLVERAVTSRTKALLPVHLYGQMCDMQKLHTFAAAHGFYVIEDAAHAIEARRDGIRPGQVGDAACFSFYPTKSITSGEGGAVAVNSKEMAERLKKLRLHGMSKGAADRYSRRYEHWDMEMLGWKYNMDNIQAALLLNQMESLDEFQARREAICQRYETAFSGCPDIKCLKVVPTSARLMFTILVPPEIRDSVLWGLQERGVGVAVNYRAIHLLTYYRQTYGYKRGILPVAESIGDATVSLPVYPALTDEEVEYVIETVKDVVRKS